jgi:hypothetical protein
LELKVNYYLIVLILVIGVLEGCTTVAPQYQPSFDNVQKLKESGNSVASVGVVTAGSDKVNSLTIRGGSFQSPYDGSYAQYVQEALQQELYDAERFSKDAEVQVSGVLVSNEIDAAGFSIGTADIEAKFVVRKVDDVRYEKVHKAHHEWPSSFVGAIAIPKAVQEYMVVVQKLLGSLYADPAFHEALK